MERPKLFGIGTEVFYRHKGKDREGEGIQCRITSVIGEGPKRRCVRLAESQPTS